MFKVLTCIATLLASTAAMAQSEVSFNTLIKNTPTNTTFSHMVKGHHLPAWVSSGGTSSPAVTVMLGTDAWQVFSACKPHDCARERIAVIWSEKSQQMAGVFSVVDEKTSQEKLTWLNVSDTLSVDGKTVLFAALSGSLDNHPDAFNYQ